MISSIKRFAIIPVVAALAILSAPFHAKADTVGVTLTGVNGGIDAGVYTSPYYATVNGVANVLVVCDDFVHDDSIGQSWTATTSSFNDLSQVRFDQGSPNQLQMYGEAAWLFDQLVQDPADAGNISFAIWAVFSPSAESSSGFTTGSDSASAWLTAAQDQTYTAGQFTNIEILTPTIGGAGSPQEFMTQIAVPTPEPSSLLLLGAALLAVVGLARWRSSVQQAATETVKR